MVQQLVNIFLVSQLILSELPSGSSMVLHDCGTIVFICSLMWFSFAFLVRNELKSNVRKIISKRLFILTAPHRQAEAKSCQHNPSHHTVSQEHPAVFHTAPQSHRLLKWSLRRRSLTLSKFDRNTWKRVKLIFIFPYVLSWKLCSSTGNDDEVLPVREMAAWLWFCWNTEKNMNFIFLWF